MKIKLKELKISMCRYSNTRGSYEEKINILESPWYIYLKNGNKDKLYENFEEIRKHPEHPNNYHYPIENFDKLYNNIKLLGYKKNFCNSNEQKIFNGDDWKGGKNIVKIGNDNFVWDGHHRCVILCFIYGDDFIINVNNYELDDIEPLNK